MNLVTSFNGYEARNFYCFYSLLDNRQGRAKLASHIISPNSHIIQVPNTQFQEDFLLLETRDFNPPVS